MAAKRKGLRFGRQGSARRPRKKRYLVVTNGEVTEPQYFKGLEKELSDVVIEVRSFRRDPSTLAEIASGLKDSESRSGSGSKGTPVDGFRKIYVVTDVDDYTSQQLQKARRICKEAGMEFVISNPCFEVWLIDHLMACPISCCNSSAAQDKAAELGIVYGSRNKHVSYEMLCGKSGTACENASRHNTDELNRKRARLDKTDFAPWTDMPNLIKKVNGSAMKGK